MSAFIKGPPKPDAINDDALSHVTGGVGSEVQCFRYVVAPGDSFAKIARRFGTTEQTLRELNELKGSLFLKVGQVLLIPAQML